MQVDIERKARRGRLFRLLHHNGTGEEGRGSCVAEPMKRADFCFGVGVMVTIVTTIAAPGGLFESFVIGTGSGVIAVGVTSMILEMIPRR